VLARHFPHTEIHGDIDLCFPESELSAVDSPARTSVTQASAPVLPEPVPDCGGQWCVPFAWYDRSTSSWRTWQRCLVEGWGRYLETWPRAGMTRNGIAYRRAPLVPLTRGTGSSSFATPTVRDAKTKGGSSYGRSLSRELIGYPNPAFVEWLMGFPAQWAMVEGISKSQHWQTRPSRKLPNGLDTG
jgi:hypothetical protein